MTGSRDITRTAGYLFVLALALLAGSARAGLNPASPGLPSSDNAYGLGKKIPNNGASSMCVDCHTTAPRADGSSHFVGPNTQGPTTEERLLEWGSTGSLRRAKYGNFTANPPVSQVGTAADLICESCHNINRNVAGGNNLLESSNLTDNRPPQPTAITDASTVTLCEGCHTTSTMAGHHPMTGDPVSSGGVLDTTDTTFTRGYAGTGASSEMGGIGSQVQYPNRNALNCLSCHANGHPGWSAAAPVSSNTGARILRRGYAGPASVAPVSPTFPVVGQAGTLIQRQYDKDASGAVRLVPNWQPLCDACHKVDD